MGKTKAKKKGTGALIKRLALICGLAVLVVIIGAVVINAINKTTIKTITVEGAYSELFIGNPELGSVEIGTSVYPATANKSSLVAYSKNPEIAQVTYNGETLSITAVGVGTTEVYLMHSSKSSLYDKVEICVSDIDVQGVTFGEMDSDGVLTPVSSVDIKKDGFEHEIPFSLDPINGNMNNIKVSDYNQAVFESVRIDQNKKALVVVPKTEIVQTSAMVDIEIYQNTTEGYGAVQVVSLLCNLKNREAYVNFELSASADSVFTTLEYTEENALKNIVYLETAESGARDVYVRPIIGYDINFESSSIFNEADYELYYDGEKIDSNEFGSDGTFIYKNKLKVSKQRGNFYYFETLSNFNQDDAIYVEFKHKFTGASGGIQFIRLDVDSIGLAGSQPFAVVDLNGNNNSDGDIITLNEKDVFPVKFTYDQAIDRQILQVETFKFVEVDGAEERVYTDVFGDDKNAETIKVKKDNKKLSIWAQDITEGTTICFAAKWNYWDARYFRILPDTHISVTFVVNSVVNGLHVEQNGEEVDLLIVARGGNTDVILVAEPEGGNFKPQNATVYVKHSGSETDDISVVITNEKVTISVDNDALNGIYEVVFEYNEVKTILYVSV